MIKKLYSNLQPCLKKDVALFLLDPKNKSFVEGMSPMEKCMLVNEKLGLTYAVEDFEKFDQFVKAQTVIKDNAESEIKQQIAQGDL